VVKREQATAWVGWVYFASAMLIVLGGLQAISGLTGIFSNDFFVATEEGLIFFNYTTWGWINLVLGVGLVLVGAFLAAGKLWAQIAAIVLGVLSAIASIAFLPAYPWWSFISLVVTGLVIYAITLHGDEVKEN